MAEALYRKYRPQTFDDVVGQEHIERTLRNAIQTDKVSHAYLFTGPRGTGKTTTARLLAKALLCEKGPTSDPDGTCEDCRLIATGEHPDVYELDAASRTGVENVREEIIGRVNYAPTRGRYKVYIIDEVHMLSVAAFNALLKTLEEPPEHVVFILCTTDPQKVPETIQSRCQRFDFRRIASEELISRLGAICEMEGVEYEGDALDLIAHRAQGGMRDALTSLEQLITFSDGSVTALEAERLLGALDSNDLADIVKAIGTRDVAACFRWTSEYVETGADLAQIAKDLAEHVRNMYVMSLAGADVALEITEAGRKELEAELAWFGPDRLSRLLAVLGDLIAELKTSTNQRLSFEIALTRMVRPDSDITLASLAERIERLERGGVKLSGDAASGNGVSGNVGISAASSGVVCREDAVSGASSVDSHASNMTHERTGDNASRPSIEAVGQKSEAALAGSDITGGAPCVQAKDALDDAGANPSASSSAEDANGRGAQAGLSPSLAGRDPMQTWSSIQADLKRQNEAYGVLFMNTFAAFEDDGKKLVIEFASSNKFAFNAAKKPEAREALEKALAQEGLSGIAYEIIQGDRAVNAARSNQPSMAANDAEPAHRSQPEHVVRPMPGDQTFQMPHGVGESPSSQSSGAIAGIANGYEDEGNYAPDDYLPSEAYEDMAQDLQASSGDDPLKSHQEAQDVSQQGAPQQGAQGDGSDLSESEPTLSESEPTLNEISDNLASMFGEGVVLEEIK